MTGMSCVELNAIVALAMGTRNIWVWSSGDALMMNVPLAESVALA